MNVKYLCSEHILNLVQGSFKSLSMVCFCILRARLGFTKKIDCELVLKWPLKLVEVIWKLRVVASIRNLDCEYQSASVAP